MAHGTIYAFFDDHDRFLVFMAACAEQLLRFATLVPAGKQHRSLRGYRNQLHAHQAWHCLCALVTCHCCSSRLSSAITADVTNFFIVTIHEQQAYLGGCRDCLLESAQKAPTIVYQAKRINCDRKKFIFEPLNLVLGLAPIGALSQIPVCFHTPTAQLPTISRFLWNAPDFLISTVRRVVPIPSGSRRVRGLWQSALPMAMETNMTSSGNGAEEAAVLSGIKAGTLSNKELLLRIFKFVTPQEKRMLAAACVAMSITSLANLSFPKLVAVLVDGMAKHDPPKRGFLLSALLM